jgi:acyl phosphate:glycerol-3-phosphate acyltransferase
MSRFMNLIPTSDFFSTNLSSHFIFAGLMVTAYILGSLCSAIVVCKSLGLTDPRTLGSGNPGTSNVLRNHGKFPAALTFIGDIVKGLLPIAAGMLIGLPTSALGWIGFAACLGHMFPVFYRFEGGKGVATAFGVLHLLYWPVALVADGVWLLMMKITNTGSVPSLASWTVAPIALFFLQRDLMLPMLCLSALIWWRHKENIRRLLKGQEHKLR